MATFWLCVSDKMVAATALACYSDLRFKSWNGWSITKSIKIMKEKWGHFVLLAQKNKQIQIIITLHFYCELQNNLVAVYMSKKLRLRTKITWWDLSEKFFLFFAVK